LLLPPRTTSLELKMLPRTTLPNSLNPFKIA
jgi:hypothetical protein